jgi:hypothetical protein
MNISTITETPHQPPAPPAAPAASGGAASGKVQEAALTQALAPVSKPASVPAPPPPPPITGFDEEVLVGIDAATNRRVYDFVDPKSGDSVVQIPAEAILNLVAKILQQLEAEGLR